MDFYINAVLIALFSLGLTHLVVNEKGPFQIMWRIKLALLPKEGRPEDMTPDWRKKLVKITKNTDEGEKNEMVPMPFNQYLIEKEAHKAAINLWTNTWDGDVRFERTFKGTFYALLTCRFCFSFWGTLIGAVLVYRMAIMTQDGLILFVLSLLVAYAIQRMLYRWF